MEVTQKAAAAARNLWGEGGVNITHEVQKNVRQPNCLNYHSLAACVIVFTLSDIS
jgi:hypothetical protein